MQWRTLLIALLFFLLIPRYTPSCQTEPKFRDVFTLYSSGVDNNDNILSSGSWDQHWKNGANYVLAQAGLGSTKYDGSTQWTCKADSILGCLSLLQVAGNTYTTSFYVDPQVNLSSINISIDLGAVDALTSLVFNGNDILTPARGLLSGVLGLLSCTLGGLGITSGNFGVLDELRLTGENVQLGQNTLSFKTCSTLISLKSALHVHFLGLDLVTQLVGDLALLLESLEYLPVSIAHEGLAMFVDGIVQDLKPLLNDSLVNILLHPTKAIFGLTAVLDNIVLVTPLAVSVTRLLGDDSGIGIPPLLLLTGIEWTDWAYTSENITGSNVSIYSRYGSSNCSTLVELNVYSSNETFNLNGVNVDPAAVKFNIRFYNSSEFLADNATNFRLQLNLFPLYANDSILSVTPDVQGDLADNYTVHQLQMSLSDVPVNLTLEHMARIDGEWVHPITYELKLNTTQVYDEDTNSTNEVQYLTIWLTFPRFESELLYDPKLEVIFGESGREGDGDGDGDETISLGSGDGDGAADEFSDGDGDDSNFADSWVLWLLVAIAAVVVVAVVIVVVGIGTAVWFVRNHAQQIRAARSGNVAF